MIQGYSTLEEAAAYIEASADRNDRLPVDALTSLLSRRSTLLELGMGPGKDLLYLSSRYKVTGSDKSRSFLEIFRKSNPKIKVLQLDAATVETDEVFDCVFSNKVLHHLNPQELESSIERQTSVLNPGGLMFHSFWLGDEVTSFGGLSFNKYRKHFLLELFSQFGIIQHSLTYADMCSDDSFALAVTVP